MSISNIINPVTFPSIINTRLNVESIKADDYISCKFIFNVPASGGGAANLSNTHIYGDLVVDGGITAQTLFIQNISADSVGCNTLVCNNETVNNNLHVTEDITAGGNLDVSTGTGTFSDILVNNNAVVVNDLFVGDNSTLNNLVANEITSNDNLVVSSNANIGNNLTVGNILSILPDHGCLSLSSLNTSQRDSLQNIQEGYMCYNNDVLNAQLFSQGLWNNIGYWPTSGLYNLRSAQSISNASNTVIGDGVGLEEIYKSDQSQCYNFNGSDPFFEVLKSGIFEMTVSVSVQPNQSDFHYCNVYVQIGKKDGKIFFNQGYTDNASPVKVPNKEFKLICTGQFYVEVGDTLCCWFYQENDTGNNFVLLKDTYLPVGTEYNTSISIKYLSPKF